MTGSTRQSSSWSVHGIQSLHARSSATVSLAGGDLQHGEEASGTVCESGRSGDTAEVVCGLGEEGAGSRRCSVGQIHHGVHRPEVVAVGSVNGRESGRWT